MSICSVLTKRILNVRLFQIWFLQMNQRWNILRYWNAGCQAGRHWRRWWDIGKIFPIDKYKLFGMALPERRGKKSDRCWRQAENTVSWTKFSRFGRKISPKPLALQIEASRACAGRTDRSRQESALSGISLNRAKLVLPYPEILIPDSWPLI